MHSSLLQSEFVFIQLQPPREHGHINTVRRTSVCLYDMWYGNDFGIVVTTYRISVSKLNSTSTRSNSCHLLLHGSMWQGPLQKFASSCWLNVWFIWSRNKVCLGIIDIIYLAFTFSFYALTRHSSQHLSRPANQHRSCQRRPINCLCCISSCRFTCSAKRVYS